MDKYDLLEAMGGIRDKYIEEAADPGLSALRTKNPDEKYIGEAADPSLSVNALRTENPDEKYIGEAADPGLSALRTEIPDEKSKVADTSSLQEDTGKINKIAGKRNKNRFIRVTRWSTAIAALLCISILIPNLFPGVSSVFRDVPLLGRYFSLVTFREPGTENSSTATAFADDSEEKSVMAMGSEEVSPLEAEDSEEAAGQETPSDEDSGKKNGLEAGDSEETAGQKTPSDEDSGKKRGLEAGDSEKTAGQETPSDENSGKKRGLEAEASEEALGQENKEEGEETFSMSTVPDHEEEYQSSLADDDFSLPSVLSAARISEDVRSLTKSYILDYEDLLLKDTGYGDMNYLYETVTDSNEWLCIAVTAYTFEAEGYQQVRHFVINKNTGEKVTLKSLFEKNTDYITPISENIITQMREEMKEDPYAQYRLDSKEEPEHDFSKISAGQDFYFDENGNLVICFDEGETAPLFMGVREFTIPAEITDSLI